MANVIITGSNSGFGKEGALAFARAGDTVYAGVRNLDKAAPLQQIAAAENLDIRAVELDVTKPETFADFAHGVVSEAGSIDVLVNNAGILRAGACEDLSESALRAVMETNFFGPMLLTRAVLPVMRERASGIVIMLSSLSGIAGLAGDVIYTASKFALEGATEALRHEVDRWGIKVALIECAQYATSLFDNDLHANSPLPADYPENSPYTKLVESRLQNIAEGLPDAQDPKQVGELMVQVARSDRSQLRWQADALTTTVASKILAQTDSERDLFLRGIAGTDWWSEGKDSPEE